MATLISAVITALVTTVAVNYLVVPRLEARNRRIQAAHIARDRFSDSVFSILGAAVRLLGVEIPDDANEELHEALSQERRRWLGQIDEATRYLVDNIEAFAFTYIGALDFRDLVIAYAGNARMVWISQRSEQAKLRLLLDLTSPVQNIYFAAWWRRRRLVANLTTLRQLLADAEADRR